MTQDLIYIKALKVNAIIGIRPHERTQKQAITIDLWMEHCILNAAASEKIEDTLDYGAISRRLTRMIEESSFHLIEALAEAITQMLQQEFKIPWFRLKLAKPEAVKNADAVGLIIERTLDNTPC